VRRNSAVAQPVGHPAGTVLVHDGQGTGRSVAGTPLNRDRHGQGATTINGVNDADELVGFYTDSAGNTDGMLALPQ
jgi:hypothetical protein